MEKWLLCAGLVVSISVLANHGKHHRHHQAHVHGKGELSIAFDGTAGQISFRSPSESILGFEQTPKNEQEKSLLQQTVSEFESEILNFVRMDPALNCQVKQARAQLESKGKHGDFVGEFKLQCQSSPLGSSIRVDFTKWKRLKSLTVTVLSGDLQKTAQVAQKPVTIELKP